jgi:hypothetical protein
VVVDVTHAARCWTRSLFIAALLLAGCGRATELSACDVADKSCQEDIYYAVVRLRGDGFDPFDGVPPIRTLTEKQYCDQLRASQPPPPEEPPPEEPPPEEPPKEPPKPMVKPWDVALQWLGLLAPATTGGQALGENRCETVAAYYNVDSQSVTVIDRDAPPDKLGDSRLLAHELVHAFQDNEVSWSPTDGTTDGNYANVAVIEGEARMYELLIVAEMQGVAARQYPWHEDFVADVDWQRANLVQNRSPFAAMVWFNYPLGADRLMQGWLRGGSAAVRHLATTAPRHTVVYMADHEGVPIDPAPPLRCTVAGPTEDMPLAGADRFGALQLFAFLTAARIENGAAWDTALSWRDDYVWLYFDAESMEVAVTWRVRLADADAAERVVAAALTRPQLRAERRGKDAVIVGSADERADWRGAHGCD